MLSAADLPNDIDALKAMLVASEARNLRKDERIERLEKLVAAFKQAAFGRKSEKSDRTGSNWRWRIWRRRLPRSMRKKTPMPRPPSGAPSPGRSIAGRGPSTCRASRR